MNRELEGIIKDKDIIGFAETWLKEEDFTINGFVCICKCRTRTKNFGRIPGGLMLLISKRLEWSVKNIKSKSEEILWSVTSNKSKDNNILIGVIYHHPRESKFFENGFFTVLSRELAEIQEDNKMNGILILGGFNARIGEEGVVFEGVYERIFIKDECTERKSKDRISNQEGRKLLNFCQENALEF